MAKFNTMIDVAFSVEHNHADPYDITVGELIAGLEKRLAYLKANATGESIEAFGICDTYEIPGEQQ